VFFSFELEIPANTVKENAASIVCKLSRGIIHYVEFQFPPGCAGLAHVYVLRGIHQIYPTNPDSTLSSDSYIIAFNDYYPLLVPPYELKFCGYNEDDTYKHTITLRLGILPEEVLAPPGGIMALLRKVARRLGL